jgi:DNA-binding NtrC family response regulator
MTTISANVMNLDLRKARDAFDRAYFLQLMIAHGGRVSRVAHHAGFDVVTCRRRLRELGLFPWIRIEG